MNNQIIQHGIRAVPNEGTRFKSTSYHLKGENYTAWAVRMRLVFKANKVWEIVEGIDVRPPPPPALVLANANNPGNVAAVVAANQAMIEFETSVTRAVFLIQESVSDDILHSIEDISNDPAAIWTTLHRKFARTSELQYESAQQAFLTFQHVETESAEQTIMRFEGVVTRARHQCVVVTD